MNKQPNFLAAAAAADRVANAQSPQEEMAAVMEVLRYREAVQIALIDQTMNQCSQTPHLQERTPLRDDGDDIGIVTHRIPAKLFYHLMQQKNFGYEGLTSDEGLRDLEKTHPICKVKTVSGKTVVSMSARSAVAVRKHRVNFGVGTMQFAR